MKLIGVVLIVLGIVALAIGGIRYTKHDEVLNIGPIHAETEEHKTIPLPPIAGAAAVISGIVLVVADSRKRA